jgi:hypothetical protein
MLALLVPRVQIADSSLKSYYGNEKLLKDSARIVHGHVEKNGTTAFKIQLI